MSSNPLVSVIVPTRNSEAVLGRCLESIKQQTYQNIELIIVDRDSTDATKDVARRYTPHVYNRGPERCAQRNFGVTQASGDYVAIIDSDMELAPEVIEACVLAVQTETAVAGVIIPEESFGEGFWAQCKKLERSFYHGVDWIEAARFFPHSLFDQLGGYDENLVSGEDWEFSQRAATHGPLARITPLIMHNEGRLHLARTLKKKVYYAGEFKRYIEGSKQNADATHGSQPVGIVFKRFGLFFSRPLKLLRRPHLGLGMLFMKVCEFGSGSLGYLLARKSRG
jgi:glycosyltransferase involved in cell wall biosynthesis